MEVVSFLLCEMGSQVEPGTGSPVWGPREPAHLSLSLASLKLSDTK